MSFPFKVQSNKWLLGLSYQVYDIRVDQYGNTLFLIYYKGEWKWIDANTVSPTK